MTFYSENVQYIHNIPQFTISEFSKNIKRIIEDNIGYIKLIGEVTGLTKSAIGHVYFSLKEKNCLINAVCFKDIFNNLQSDIENGLEVVISGRITTYSARSNYQIIVEDVGIAGIGPLLVKLEKLKQKLQKEGLFDKKHKKIITKYPSQIGLITSHTGAVFKDISHRIEERFPTNIKLYSVTVQGQKAKNEIIEAIRYFNQLKYKPDVLIIARGGGSFEDLFIFNEEEIVREIFLSKIPVVSAIGHETDNVLIDYVSDLRAPTPTAAAEMTTEDIKNIEYVIKNLSEKLVSNIEETIESWKNIIYRFEYVLNNFNKKINNKIENVELGISYIKKHIDNSLCYFKSSIEYKYDILSPITNRIKKDKDNLNILISAFEQIITKRLEELKNNILLKEQILSSYHYKNILLRGYSLLKNKKDVLIKDVSLLKENEEIKIELGNGSIIAKIKKIYKNEN